MIFGPWRKKERGREGAERILYRSGGRGYGRAQGITFTAMATTERIGRDVPFRPVVKVLVCVGAKNARGCRDGDGDELHVRRLDNSHYCFEFDWREGGWPVGHSSYLRV